jgi:hypothetical protein
MLVKSLKHSPELKLALEQGIQLPIMEKREEIANYIYNPNGVNPMKFYLYLLIM